MTSEKQRPWIPAFAGMTSRARAKSLDPRLRGDDERKATSMDPRFRGDDERKATSMDPRLRGDDERKSETCHAKERNAPRLTRRGESALKQKIPFRGDDERKDATSDVSSG